MSIGRRTDKEVVVHIQWNITQVYITQELESVLMRWMNLEPVIQSEVSQKKRNTVY